MLMQRVMAAAGIVALCGGMSLARAGEPVPEGSVCLENQALRVVAQGGQRTVAVYAKGDRSVRRAELGLVAFGAAQAAPIDKAEVVENEAGESVLHVVAGGAQAQITLSPGVFVKLSPGENAASVEVGSDARYVAVPDFFADDAIFDPLKFKADLLTVPAENFLLQMIAGGDSMVMCIWPGNLKLPTPGGAAATGPKLSKEDADPQVDLLFRGSGPSRRVAAARIEFQHKPVYVGVLEHQGIWHDAEVGALPAYQPAPIAWKRPFEARWRGDFIVADGKIMNDWPSRNQSFEFQSTSSPRTDQWWQRGTDALDARFAAATSNSDPHKWWVRGDENAPQIWQESLAGFFIYPAVFKGDEVRLCLYADKAERDRAQKATQAARKIKSDAPQTGPPNVYERVIIYPLGRVPATPLLVSTPVDLMRETLGAGPCEYVLDLAGVKPQPAGGDRPILSYATCGLWNDHISPLVGRFQKRADDSFERLDEKDAAHLVQALEEMWYFVHAVHDRLRQYKSWGAEMAAFCQRQAAERPAVQPLAEKAMAHIARLNADIARHRFEGAGSEAYWKDRIPELVAMVHAGKYADVATVGKIRDLGNEQDQRVSRCRQYVKALRQEILLQETSDPEARQFAAEIRDRCHQMLRNMHPKEGF